MVKFIEGMEREAKLIRQEALKMTWYMRGGVQYTDVLNMSRDERDAINSIVKDNLDTTKKTQLPFF